MLAMYMNLHLLRLKGNSHLISAPWHYGGEVILKCLLRDDVITLNNILVSSANM